MKTENKITPRQALETLQQYHESVMSLVNMIEFVVSKGLIDAPVVTDIKKQIEEVKRFYKK